MGPGVLVPSKLCTGIWNWGVSTDGNWEGKKETLAWSVALKAITGGGRGPHLEQVGSLAACGGAEGGHGTQRAPEVDVGQQRTGSQQESWSLGRVEAGIGVKYYTKIT